VHAYLHRKEGDLSNAGTGTAGRQADVKLALGEEWEVCGGASNRVGLTHLGAGGAGPAECGVATRGCAGLPSTFAPGNDSRTS